MGMDMLKLGLFTVVAGFITTATMYLVRIFISQKMNIDAVGIFQAAWTLSTLYIGLVLDAMATDYFPRLSEVNQDNSSLKKLVNEQTEVALVIAIPLITGMLVFLPFIVRLFYSAKFEAAIPILDWQLLGVFLRLIGWPMGFVILAKAKGKIFVFTQFFWNLLFGGFIFFGWRSFQLEITGIAFFLAYLLGVPLNFFILKKIIGFHWTNKTVQMMIFSSLFVFGAFLTIRLLPSPYHYIVGSTIFLGSLLYSYLALRKMVVIKSIFQSIFREK
jgi:PST family polysaccharide transporter